MGLKPDASEQLRLAVFDCDGTLVDSQHSIIASMRAAFNTHGLSSPEDYAIRRVVGLPLMEAITLLHPGLSEPVVEQLHNDFKAAWQNIRQTTGFKEPPYDGCEEALGAMANDGWTLGVATGKSYHGLVSTLEETSLLERFATLQTANRAPGKPNPSMLFKAMEETGAAREDTVMIGDTTYDMEMAVNAGVLAIGVAWGYHEIQELEMSGARTVVRTYAELPDLLKKLMEK